MGKRNSLLFLFPAHFNNKAIPPTDGLYDALRDGGIDKTSLVV